MYIKSFLLAVDPQCTSRSLIHPSSESHDAQCGPQQKTVAGSRTFTLRYPTPVLSTKSFSHPLSSSSQESGHSCPEADLTHQPLSYVPGPGLPFTYHCLRAFLPHGISSHVGSEYVFTVFYIVRVFFSKYWNHSVLTFIGCILRKGIVFCLSLSK